ncbi:MAG TPA: aminofutalosine synthase MqnE [Methylomirabilota bacterium]|jgi:aminodeoxyfutalosine synthase|nr:aminofutalosine synthase MqnE [Methylomirabilota bacterium]
MHDPVEEIRFRDPRLAEVWDKVRAGQRLGAADGLACLETADLLALGRMADRVKQKKSGDWVYFVINRYINPTNVCVLACSFCDFARRKGEAGAFEYSADEIVAMIDPDIREVHIVGGHHPDWPFDYYEKLVRAIRRERPLAQIKAFTAAEIDYFWRRWKIDPREALVRLKAAGLHSMPGGGAEVFSVRLQKALHYTGKAGADRWLEIHRIAHGLGIRSNATILYGHIETYAERIEHLLRLRALQDETAGFLTFIPLTYQVGDTKLVPRQASSVEELRMVATSRLMLDNFPHVEAYWVMMGEATASIALHFGADDVNGTLVEERIAHAAKAESPAGLAREQILRMIRDAGKVPVERDALYGVVQVFN